MQEACSAWEAETLQIRETHTQSYLRNLVTVLLPDEDPTRPMVMCFADGGADRSCAA